MTRKERFKQWLEKDTAKDILAPMVSEYDLKDCIELKKKLSRHENKIFYLACIPALFFEVLAVGYMAISKYLADMNIIGVSDPDLNGIAFLFMAFMFIMIWAGYGCFTSIFKKQLDKRIETIAGVYDGKETESNDKQ